jgi:hypothetical protein
LVFESDKRDENKNVCEICYEEKTKGRVDEWLKDIAGETIWTTELKDKNDRLALVVMKFELMDWLNGDLLSSMLIRKDVNMNYKQRIKNFLIVFCSNIDLDIDTSNLDSRNVNKINSLIDKLRDQKW